MTDASDEEVAKGPKAIPTDPDRAAMLREIAEDIRGESSESELLAALVYRVSDLYDPDEETTPTEIYLAMRTMVRTREAGGRG